MENIGNEISGEIAAQTVRTLLDAQQIAAPQSYFHSIEYLENRAKELSLFHITLHEQPISRFEWEVRKAELWMLAPVTRKLADFRAVKSSLAAFSRSAHVMAELIDVGTGESDANYAGFDIAGKIVLASGKLEAVMRKAVWQFGALGVLSYHENSTADRGRSHSVQSWQTVPISDGNGKTGTFAFHIPAETALALKHLLASESESATLGRQKVRQQQTKVLLRADIDASVGDAGKSWSLSAEIPGEEILSENIVLSAVLPDNSTPPFHDLAGAAGLLEIARTLNRLINEGLLPVPRRTIKFWWIPDANTVTRTFINRPEAKDSILANLHLGAIGYDNEFSGGTRIWLSPKSNASYWNDVVESLASGIHHATTRQSSSEKWRFPDDALLYASTGSTAPYLPNSDARLRHPVIRAFAPSAIGIPSIALTAYDAPGAPTREQLVSALDPTPLERNMLLAAIAVWYLANFEDANITPLVATVYQRSQARLAHTLQAAFAAIIRDGNTGYSRAEILIEESILRETETLRSIGFLATNPEALEVIDDFANKFRDDEKSAMNRIKLLFSSLYQRRPPKAQIGQQEKMALRLVPRNNSDLPTYLSRNRTAAADEFVYAQQEILNYVNGQRSLYEIYRAVLAESILAGESGNQLTLEHVTAIINKAVKDGLLAY